MPESHLIYTSCAVSSLTAVELDQLASQSTRNNEKLGITGLLLYGGGRFLQLLEGPTEAVTDLYENRIVKDTRHTDCRELLSKPCEVHLFPNWQMGRMYLQETEGSVQNCWDALCVEIGKQNPEAIFSRDPAIRIIEQFIRHFGQHADRPSSQGKHVSLQGPQDAVRKAS